MYSCVFRVDAGNIPELGTGHLYRCITIYNYLLQRGIKKNQLQFVIKSKNNYLLAKKILKKKKISFISIDEKIKDFSKKELNFLSSFKSNVIIFDRLSKINRNFLDRLRVHFKKIVGIDLKKKNDIKLDLYFNPLQNNIEQKKKIKNYKNNILPSIFFKKIKKNYSQKKLNLFTFFGGYDFKNINKKVKLLENIKSINLKNDQKKFYFNLNKADIVICSGGLTVFDAIYLNKIIIAIPQYNHQLINLRCLHKQKVCYLIKLNRNFEKNLYNCIKKILSLNLKEKNLIYLRQKKIISYNSQIKLLDKIYDYSKSIF